jgi:RNA polymerase sigma-70 factor (ECF subfamily)
MSDEDAYEGQVQALLEAGDLQGAVTAALRGYGPSIVCYLKVVLHDDDAAYEVFAQFGEDLWRGIGRFRGECSFRIWAYRLALYAARRHLRDVFRCRVRRLETAEVSQIVAEIRTSTVGYQPIAVKDRLARIREQLTPGERTLLVLRVEQEFSWQEVAEVLSSSGRRLPEAIVRKRFERLRRKLRRLAREEGL